MSDTVSFEKRGDVAVMSIDNPPVNALSHSVREGISEAIAELAQDADLKAAVLICAGRTFIAGADIREFGKPIVPPTLIEVVLTIARSEKPVVAAMHGTVLGGGFEVALGCHYRVALSSTKVGLPEVTLGLIPGAGGTQMLPRLAGVSTALEMITSGRHLSVQSEIGVQLVDEVVEGSSYDELLAHGINAAQSIIAGDATARRLTDVQPERAHDHDTVFGDARAAMAKKKRGLLCVQNAIDSVENAVLLPLDEGLAQERNLFEECRESSQSQAMRHAFFAERACAKVEGLDKDIKALPVSSVAVVGAGTMGVGIAMCFADAGMHVRLLEVDDERVQSGVEKIRSNYERSVSRGRISGDELEARCARIAGSTNFEDLADADLVVEAAFESMEVKNEVFAKLDKACKPEAILATNTSYLDINEISAATERPDKVLGMHFFSPAHVMKLLEIVRADRTSDETLATAIAVAKRIRKIPVTVGVCYGFVGNRMYARYGAEAQNLVLEGATPEQVDNAIQEWGMAMGPFQVADLTGLDIGYKARKHQPDLPDDPKYFALSTAFVEAGRLGQKTSAGFYRYEDSKRLHDDEAIDLIRATAAGLGVVQKSFDAAEIQDRLIAALVEEGRAVLQEGIAQRSSDIDVIWLNGYGFPRHLGGPMWYAENAK